MSDNFQNQDPPQRLKQEIVDRHRPKAPEDQPPERSNSQLLEKLQAAQKETEAIIQRIRFQNTRRKIAEARQQKEAGQLRERIKELNCLFSISDLFRNPGLGQAEIFQGIVDRIPFAWQYPENAYARLVMENREFQTANFRLTPWKTAADILVNGQPLGFLEVGYLQEKDWGKGGPFLAEETHLVKEIAERAGIFIARLRAEEALEESEKGFRALFEQAAVGVAQIETTTGRFMRVNQRYGDIVGYSQEEMRLHTFQEITYPEDLQEDLENTERLIAGKIRESSREKRYRHKNGSLILGQSYGFPHVGAGRVA